MSKEILQLENTNANDFKNEIVKDVTNALKGYAETLQNPEIDKLLTRQETCEMLSISLVTLWDWTKKDLLPAYKIGNKVRYKKQEILLALQQMNKFSS
ncbi:helix-turn-helix domain-containing protein [Flavobacterium sp.]|uniref:helix-turn-helix domain-containing protein n=1 Tax=Flavobacterium sp. TaxID=239 RepID=UPI0037523DB7